MKINEILLTTMTAGRQAASVCPAIKSPCSEAAQMQAPPPSRTFHLASACDNCAISSLTGRRLVSHFLAFAFSNVCIRLLKVLFQSRLVESRFRPIWLQLGNNNCATFFPHVNECVQTVFGESIVAQIVSTLFLRLSHFA